MKFFLYLVIFLLVAGLVCSRTVPDKDTHVRSVALAMIEEIESGELLPGIKGTRLAKKATDHEFVRNCVEQMLQVEDFGLFSLGRIVWMGNEYIVSLGVLGRVMNFSDAKAAKEFIGSFETKAVRADE